MYYALLLLLLISLFGTIFSCIRRKKIICRIQCMDKCQKCNLLDELANPLGYAYHCRCGFFTSTTDAWQKEAGYTGLYDDMAPRFQMVFDALPIYFDYRGQTWLIELWKGQYGINTGAEIGIYHADRLLSEAEYRTAHFTAADEDEMLTCTLRLCDREEECLQITQQHWWHTAFLPGCFTSPKDLCLSCAICFPNIEMCDAFYDGLCRVGYSPSTISINGLCLSFTFRAPASDGYDLATRFHRRLSQFLNRIFCGLYLRITRPFFRTEDRILFLYYDLPVLFRRLLRLRRFHRRCHKADGCHPPQVNHKRPPCKKCPCMPYTQTPRNECPYTPYTQTPCNERPSTPSAQTPCGRNHLDQNFFQGEKP